MVDLDDVDAWLSLGLWTRVASVMATGEGDGSMRVRVVWRDI